MHRYAVPQEEAKERLAASDRKRANYCQRFTCKTWGKADNYTLSFDSTSLGIDYVVDMIVQTIQHQQRNRENK